MITSIGNLPVEAFKLPISVTVRESNPRKIETSPSSDRTVMKSPIRSDEISKLFPASIIAPFP